MIYMYIHFNINLVLVFLSVGGVCNFLSSVSSQQKFEEMDQRYSPQTNRVTVLGQISVTAPGYISVLFRKWRKIHHRGMRPTQKTQREERDPRPFGSSFCMFFLLPLSLLYVNWASQEWLFVLPKVLTPVPGPSFVLFSPAFPILVF